MASRVTLNQPSSQPGTRLQCSAARGKADGKDTSWTSSTVTAGKVLGLQSGGDTSLIGAIGQADRIVAQLFEVAAVTARAGEVTRISVPL